MQMIQTYFERMSSKIARKIPECFPDFAILATHSQFAYNQFDQFAVAIVAVAAVLAEFVSIQTRSAPPLLLKQFTQKFGSYQMDLKPSEKTRFNLLKIKIKNILFQFL